MVKNITADATAEKPAEVKHPAGFCMYIGPTIVGVIQNATIYPGDRKKALARPDLSIAAGKHPEISKLVVSGDDLPDALKKVKTPGEDLYRKYNSIAKKK